MLSAQLLYPLITKESFKRIFDARLFDSEDVQLSNTVGKGEYGQGTVYAYTLIFITVLVIYLEISTLYFRLKFLVYAGQLISSNFKIAAKEINLPLRNNSGTRIFYLDPQKIIIFRRNNASSIEFIF